MASAKWFTVINKSLTRAGRKAPAQYSILATTKSTKSGGNALSTIIYDPFPLGGGPAIDRRAEFSGLVPQIQARTTQNVQKSSMQMTGPMKSGVKYKTPGGFDVTIIRPYEK